MHRHDHAATLCPCEMPRHAPCTATVMLPPSARARCRVAAATNVEMPTPCPTTLYSPCPNAV
eukprot:843433-Prymnesium_polylepis.1